MVRRKHFHFSLFRSFGFPEVLDTNAAAWSIFPQDDGHAMADEFARKYQAQISGDQLTINASGEQKQ